VDVEPAQSPLRRLLHLELIERGYYTTSRGLVALSLPVADSDLQGFVLAVREVLLRYAPLLPTSGAAT
jgi:glutamate-1-semialdehyde 2,1-aminomutase